MRRPHLIRIVSSFAGCSLMVMPLVASAGPATARRPNVVRQATTTRPRTTTTRRSTTTTRRTTTTRPPTTTTTTTTTTLPPTTAAPPPPPPPPPAPSAPTPAAVPAGLAACPSSATAAMIALVNRDRQQASDLPALHENSHLDWAATEHSVAMASTSNMSHGGWDAEIAASGFAPGPPGWMAQNVALRSGGYSPDAIESMLFNETPPNDGHRQNILSTNAHQIGIGCVVNNATGVYWWTQNLGS